MASTKPIERQIALNLGWLMALLANGCGDGETRASFGQIDSACEQAEAQLLFVGDTMFAGELPERLAAAALSFDAVFDPVRTYVAQTSYAVFNLESAVAPGADPINKEFTFNSDTQGLEALAHAGFDLADLANNHSLDYGPVGLEQTLDQINTAGLQQFGLSVNGQPQAPVIIQRCGFDIGFLAYADPEAPFAYAAEFFDYDTRPAEARSELMEADLKRLTARVDVVVVVMHWGVEGEGVSQRQHELGHFLLEHGAQLVVGHHPHIQQVFERSAQGVIAYSLGNFVFGLWSEPRQLRSQLFRVGVAPKKIVSTERLELKIDASTLIPYPVYDWYTPVDFVDHTQLP